MNKSWWERAHESPLPDLGDDGDASACTARRAAIPRQCQPRPGWRCEQTALTKQIPGRLGNWTGQSD